MGFFLQEIDMLNKEEQERMEENDRALKRDLEEMADVFFHNRRGYLLWPCNYTYAWLI